jgi:enediyne biosynthesis protein E4
VGTKSNRSAIGAHVEVTAGELRQYDEVRSGGSYGSQSDFRLHFGLGRATRVDALEIRWPGGKVERLTGIAANQCVRVREGEGIVKTTQFQ